MTKISATLRAAVLSGAVGLLPSMAFADSGSSGTETPAVPDHAAAEARSAGAANTPSEETKPGVPDHATAESRGQGEMAPSAEQAADRTPDHATAERRGAPSSNVE
jgi:hypothetical protein